MSHTEISESAWLAYQTATYTCTCDIEHESCPSISSVKTILQSCLDFVPDQSVCIQYAKVSIAMTERLHATGPNDSMCCLSGKLASQHDPLFQNSFTYIDTETKRPVQTPFFIYKSSFQPFIRALYILNRLITVKLDWQHIELEQVNACMQFVYKMKLKKVKKK